MLLSVFTPTHDPRWLRQTYRSLQLQNYPQWEWVLTPNGPRGYVPPDIQADLRVRVYEGAREMKNIGAIKRYACRCARGDAFAELDHDDLLVPGHSLTRIAEAVQAGAGFVFSDDAYFWDGTLKAHQFNNPIWVNYPISVYGRRLVAQQCFDVTPRSLCEVYWAPDHIRVWSRKAYEMAGGHDPELFVGDDNELMCRTYLTGQPFEHIKRCLYLYRLHPGNSFKARQKELRKQVDWNRQRYLEPLIREWCRQQDYRVLELPELPDPWSTWMNLLRDQNAETGLITLPDSLQYLDPGCFEQLIRHCYGSLVPGGYLAVRIPANREAETLHPSNQTYTTSSFLPFCDRELARETNDRILSQKVRFQLIDTVPVPPTDISHRYGLQYATIYLSALKGQRHPGTQRI